eukprot:scaffold234477_cov24-Prasinocladus_malaysianus.AAC.1
MASHPGIIALLLWIHSVDYGRSPCKGQLSASTLAIMCTYCWAGSVIRFLLPQFDGFVDIEQLGMVAYARGTIWRDILFDYRTWTIQLCIDVNGNAGGAALGPKIEHASEQLISPRHCTQLAVSCLPWQMPPVSSLYNTALCKHHLIAPPDGRSE